ncbi:helix-turn-helix domain-containing protein [Pedobacter lithocola]|uniref:Helix-turn-helix domain-containing protein n=1 Tax=Pedobacter lithocola TaxID=1908239 RepID=A0ABV8PAF1_9SPHI
MENSALLIGIKKSGDCSMSNPVQFSNYTVLLVTEGEGVYHADFGAFPFKGPILLFSTPLQQIFLEETSDCKFTILQFHGDFYCIEFHRAEVSCNGLLFNNIYLEPAVGLTQAEAFLFAGILTDIEAEFNADETSDTVLRAYLQLFLAKSSSIKIRLMDSQLQYEAKDEQMERFITLLEANYLTLHTPGDYAALLAMTTNNFSKRTARYFKKSPSALIQERIVMEAKKKLHLTRLSIKEIAYQLNFTDEYYFSRFFKKFTKVSPQSFRQLTGISKVADQ